MLFSFIFTSNLIFIGPFFRCMLAKYVIKHAVYKCKEPCRSVILLFWLPLLSIPVFLKKSCLVLNFNNTCNKNFLPARFLQKLYERPKKEIFLSKKRCSKNGTNERRGITIVKQQYSWSISFENIIEIYLKD